MQSSFSYSKASQTTSLFPKENYIHQLNMQFIQDDRHSPQREMESHSTKKMAIPRLPEGAEASLSSLGRFHRRHVRRACESCRQRKTKCTGDKSGCRNCREAGIICCYTDGKREKSKRYDSLQLILPARIANCLQVNWRLFLQRFRLTRKSFAK